MTATRSPSGTARPAKPSAISASRVGPVITTVASVVGAVIMFGLGVLAGRVVASVLGIDGAGRTALMLGLGVVFGLGSAMTSARRHLPRH
jgi:hypothetical protein